MRTNDLIIFIDSKGVGHNALVKSFREHRDEKDKLVHPTPLVTLTYHMEPTGEPKEVIDVQHISHPGRQETNPDLPTYALHAWAYEGEDYLEVPPDHPLHDHPYALPEKDQDGNIVPKRRPIYEKHIEWHKSGRVSGTIETAHGEVAVAPILRHRIPLGQSFEHNPPDGPVKANTKWDQFIMTPGSESARPNAADMAASGLASGSGSGRYETSRPDVMNGVLPGHPGHPDTIRFPWTCESCGKLTERIASHQGGKLWEPKAGAQQEGALLGGDNSALWQEHVCQQPDIDAYRESLKPKPGVIPEPSPSERLAAGETLAKMPETATEKEPDVAKQLDEAGIPPDAATGS